MKKLQLLLIDDDSDEFDFFLTALDKIPGLFDCSYAASGAAACELLKLTTPDYIFVDMNMPLMNGLECIEKIHSIKEIPEIPIYVYSTGAGEILRARSIHIGAKGCIRKPSNTPGLIEMLIRLYNSGDPEEGPAAKSKLR
jgi:CheY-like chemotaxis protein